VESILIQNISYVQKRETTYNLSLENNTNFFVGSNQFVLVHNNSCNLVVRLLKKSAGADGFPIKGPVRDLILITLD